MLIGFGLCSLIPLCRLLDYYYNITCYTLITFPLSELQREKELNQEARKEIEEMKTKVYSLRMQKLELDKKVTQMESTISSLMDERKVIRLALKEKKNEFKMLATRENPESVDMFQITALKNIIKMKDEEILALISKPETSCAVTKKDTENAKGLQGSSNSSGKGTLDSAKMSKIRLNEEQQKSGENQSVEWSNDSETRKEFNLEDHPRNLNQTVDIGHSREEDTKNKQQGSLTSTKEGSYEHVKNQMQSEGVNERNQISDENSKQLQDRKANTEHNMEMTYENDKEQENEEGEAEEETRQLEIDRDDITFLETNVEEADSDESEF